MLPPGNWAVNLLMRVLTGPFLKAQSCVLEGPELPVALLVVDAVYCHLAAHAAAGHRTNLRQRALSCVGSCSRCHSTDCAARSPGTCRPSACAPLGRATAVRWLHAELLLLLLLLRRRLMRLLVAELVPLAQHTGRVAHAVLADQPARVGVADCRVARVLVEEAHALHELLVQA